MLSTTCGQHCMQSLELSTTGWLRTGLNWQHLFHQNHSSSEEMMLQHIATRSVPASAQQGVLCMCTCANMFVCVCVCVCLRPVCTWRRLQTCARHGGQGHGSAQDRRGSSGTSSKDCCSNSSQTSAAARTRPATASKGRCAFTAEQAGVLQQVFLDQALVICCITDRFSTL